MSAQAPTLGGSATVFSFKGIRVHVHWTFLILVGWVAINGAVAGMNATTIAAHLGLVLLVFGCVVLHEFGHALTALRFGVRTRDITLLSIGGMANLERMPEEPREEFWITVAGPAVNLVIAGLAFLGMTLFGIEATVSDVLLGGSSWRQVLVFLFSVNVMLFLFNLVPAFPMDGGRILRSLLAMFLPRHKATRIAAGVGRLFAVCFIVAGLFSGAVFLALIGVFVFFAAGAESRMVQQTTALQGIRVRMVMRTRFWSMPHDATVRQAVAELLAGGDSDLVVMRSGRYMGVLTRRDLLRAITEQRQDETLEALMPEPVPTVASEEPVNAAYGRLMAGRHAVMPVMDQGELVGVLEPENLTEWLMVKDAMQEAGRDVGHAGRQRAH